MTRSGTRDNRTKPSEKALPAVFADKAFRVERKGVEPSTSALRTQESRVPSGNLSDVAATADSRCTNGCTSGPGKRRKRGPDAGARPTEPKGPGDFAAALVMIAGLPLSDAEKAEAVRRLLNGSGSASG